MAGNPSLIGCVIVEKKYAKTIKNTLSQRKILNKQYRITPWRQKHVAIPFDAHANVAEVALANTVSNDIIYEIQLINESELRSIKVLSHASELNKFITSHIAKRNAENLETLCQEIPKKWEVHGDLLLFSKSVFQHEFWDSQSCEFWSHVADILGVKRLGIKSQIEQDNFRTPKVKLLLGNDPIVRHIDNGIVYEYDVTKLMFSKGNISEKLRIASFDCNDEIIVDMFAGIGYFVLPYIMKAGAKKVIACEWNPVAVKMLKKNLEINNVSHKCEVRFGDNREVTPKGIADRVNLGLIPTSSKSWKTACEALNKKRGGVLHIHENIESKPNFINKQKDGELLIESDSVLNHSNDFVTGLCQCDGAVCVIEHLYTGALSPYKRSVWCDFVRSMQCLLEKYFEENIFKVTVEHIEYLKSYAPHVDNLVFDVRCTPI